MKYQRYPVYKASGVEWLGEVPEHWDIKKLKFIANVQPSNVDKKTNASEIPVLLCNYTDVYYNDTVNAAMEFMNASATEEQVKKFTLRAGDTIITKDSEDPNDIAIPTFVPENMDGVICGYHLSIIRPYAIAYGAYIKRVFECGYARAYFATRSNGLTRYGLGTYPLDNVCFPKPTKEEAAIIANFLDHETAKIDTLIEKQRRLIELLKEKRQAVISHAVTKGLNPNAPMKDSGVEWLGEVPEHWRVTRAKFLFDFITSGSRGWAEYYSDDGALFFRITNLTRDTIEPKLESIQNVTLPSSGEGERAKINKNDLLISITADLGSVCVANDDIAGGYVSQHVSLCRPNKNVASSRWLGFYILSDIAKEQFLGSGYGGTKIQLSLEDIRELLIVKPVESDQLKIAEYIDGQLNKFSKIIMFSEEQIRLLQERRTALISAAVTGKIDVRHWQVSNDTKVFR